ncbi:hypothetical protein GCM10011611_24900 [Aliidongia dinghuensis]|uniref:Uncharacterized protein n=1 Tax=Aliidongia dinghuensis TaxID=1867774 RepID=A0A8J3E252_9PROT|nr:hypothetical protein [Aliidongia dinghuensis]GGF18079.1 hypothetical protein GCM10011611_24900 [Aliidongia dinghuensis]
MKRSTRPAGPAKRLTTERKKVEENVALPGGIATSLTQIRSSSVNLVITFGQRDDGDDVLVPLVEWQLFGQKSSGEGESDRNDPPPELSSHLLTLDNLAFLLQDIGFDTRNAARLLSAQSNSQAGLMKGRLDYTLRMLRLASEYISDAAEKMEEVLLRSDDEPPADNG